MPPPTFKVTRRQKLILVMLKIRHATERELSRHLSSHLAHKNKNPFISILLMGNTRSICPDSSIATQLA